jgi:hypothetical protein
MNVCSTKKNVSKERKRREEKRERNRERKEKIYVKGRKYLADQVDY